MQIYVSYSDREGFYNIYLSNNDDSIEIDDIKYLDQAKDEINECIKKL